MTLEQFADLQPGDRILDQKGGINIFAGLSPGGINAGYWWEDSLFSLPVDIFKSRFTVPEKEFYTAIETSINPVFFTVEQAVNWVKIQTENQPHQNWKIAKIINPKL